MNELQKVQLDLLKEFIRVCEKNKLTYYLFGGSCLGAIRHQGFIPWDDDMDIAMPRPDFDKLMKLGHEFPDPFFLQNIRSDKHYVYSFAKLRNSNTTYIEYAYSHCRMNHGVWIDIFPLDGMSKRIGKKEIKSLKPLLIWAGFCFAYCGHQVRSIRWDKHFFADLGLDIVGILFFPWNIANWMTKCLERYEKRIPWHKATLVGPYETAYLNQEALPPQVFGEGIPAKFEGLDVKVPSDYHAYLSHIYGNYMKLPPIEKQIGHHVHNGLDLNTPYKQYLGIKDKKTARK